MQKGFAPILLIIVLLIIILLGGAGWYFFNQRSASPTESSQTTQQASPQPTQEATPSETSETMSGLIGRGQNLECDWHMPTETQSPFGTGKLWTSGNQGRSQISGTVSGIAMEANALFKEGTVYSWLDMAGQKTGFRMNPDEVAEANSRMTPQQQQQTEQIRQRMLFSCHPWTPDPSKFVLPTDVSFR